MKYCISHITDNIIEVRIGIIPDIPTNAYIILSNNCNYIIDTGFGSGTSLVMLKFIDNSKPNYIINTHYHWDHIWGDSYIPDATIFCHELCKQKIVSEWDEMIDRNKKYIDGEVKLIEPQITFDSKLCINDELELFYAPGHTDDCIGIYYHPGKVLFVGDNFGDNDNEIIPLMDMDKSYLVNTLNIFESYRAELFLSGHNTVKKPEILTRMKKLL